MITEIDVIDSRMIQCVILGMDDELTYSALCSSQQKK